MTRHLRLRIVAALTTLFAAALVLILTLVGLSAASSAAVAHPLRTGLGYRLSGGDFVGYYVTTQGRKVYCIDPGKAAPTAVGLGRVRNYAGMSRTTVARLNYALTLWGDAHSRSQAAVESQVVNTLVGNGHDVRRRARAIPGRLRATVAAHVRQSRALSGPYGVRVSLGRAALPGQSSTGSVQVRAANGVGVGRVRLRVTHSGNSTVTRTLVTDRAGRARFTWTATGLGTVRIGAVADALPAAWIQGTRPPQGVQRMISWSPRVAASGTDTTTRSPVGFSTSYGCSTTCNGRPRTALRACAPGSGYRSRIVFDAGRHTLVVNFAAGRNRRCVSRSVRLSDGDRVSGRWQYRTPRGWSRAVPAPGGIRIDCPATPAVDAEVMFDCSAALVHIELAQPSSGSSSSPAGSVRALVNTTAHRMVLVIGGAASKRIVAGHGQGASFTASVPCTHSETFTARAGVQRANGAYNYGPIASLSTPGRG